MAKTIVQIYEIQTPEEARSMLALGVDHIGSVLLDEKNRKDPLIKETLSVARQLGAVGSLIPLFTDPDVVAESLAYHNPQVVHFCDALKPEKEEGLKAAIDLQRRVKQRFSQIQIMRSIPIPSFVSGDGEAILDMAARLEPVSDFFLTDTVLTNGNENGLTDQPVDGFVGITGRICDWQVARRLVEQSGIPVILAGGISPENVTEGILAVRPYGVDSCTQTNATDVNDHPVRFKKDETRVKILVARAKQADTILEQNQ